MLDQLLDTIQNQIGQNLKEDNDFNGDHNQVSKVAGESIISQLSGLAQNGNFAGISELFSGEETRENSEVMNEIQPKLESNLMDKLGIDGNSAKSLVMKILPFVMNMFNDKVKQNQKVDNGIDISSIIGSLTGGGGNNQGGMSQITDIIGALVGNNDQDSQPQQQKSSGGGIFNIIKGLFGK